MKKLMTTLSAVGVALGLYAADTGTSFEGLGAGAYTITAPGDIGTGGEIVNPDGGTFWSNVTESATLTINNVGAFTTLDKRSPKFNENSNVNFLDVKTTLGNPVYRKVNLDGSAQTMGGSGIYFDSYVKFTAFEDAASLPALGDGKLAIWLMQDDPDNPSVTNLMITAGYLSGLTAVATNYLCHIDGDTYDTALNDGGWHRVTVKAVNTIYGGNSVPGFIVYIDGMVVRTGDIEGINSKGIVESSLTDAAAYLHKDRLGAIFPSVVQSGGDKQTITAVGFDGQGSVDDVLFTSDEPFPEVTEFFTIQAGDNVVSFTYAVDSGSESAAISGKALIPYSAGMTVTITPTYSAGCVDGTWTPAEIVSDHNVSPTAAGQTVTVNGVFSRASVIYVEDNVVKTNYSATAAAAFTFINNTGAGDYYVSLSDAATEGGINLNATGANVILDLAGTNITAGASDSAAIYIENGALTITNSVEGVGGIVDAGSAAAAVASIGSDALTIEAGTYNGLVSAENATPFAINGGAFDKASNDGMLGSAVLPEGKALVDGTGDFVGYLVLGDAPQPQDSWTARLGEPDLDGAYKIDDYTDLTNFQAGVAAGLPTTNETFKLTANIPLVAAWPGIGIQNGKDIASTTEFNEGAFRGTFDGQNYTISNFQMVGGGLDYCGFFNSVYEATIRNLKIQYAGANFATDTSISSLESGATFVGVAKKSTLQNLTTVAGTVSCSKGFGGISGYTMGGTTVENCTNNVNMTSVASNKCGGVAMIVQSGSGDAIIRNCQNNGSVTTDSKNKEFGGIVGYIGDDITIDGCESTVAYKLFHRQNHKNGYVPVVTMSGVNKGNATVLAYTSVPADSLVSGLNFATVDGNVATFVADNALALNGSYKVMAAGGAAPTFAFAEAGTISFDTNLAQNVSFNITASDNLDLTDATVAGVVTFTATDATPSEIDPESDVLAVDIKATDAIDATNKVVVAVPAGSGAVAAEYKALFKIEATLKSEGVYTVEITGIKDEVVADVSADAVDALTDSDKDTVTIPAGLYYRISPGAALPITTVSTYQGLSTGSVDKPATGGDGSKGFYKVELSPKPFPVLPPES